MSLLEKINTVKYNLVALVLHVVLSVWANVVLYDNVLGVFAAIVAVAGFVVICADTYYSIPSDEFEVNREVRDAV